MKLRILQISDLHLGGGVSPALELEPEKADRLRRAPLAALSAACDLARAETVDAILIPGDLFDAEAVDASTINETVALLNAVAPIPVFIAPGNHDFYSADGFYNRDFLSARGRAVWGDHVRIFTGEAPEAVPVPGREGGAIPGVLVWGSCFTGNVALTKRPLAEPVPADRSNLNVLLLHGSREGFATGRKVTCPFNDRELLAQPFDYTALGHYHGRAEIRDEKDVRRAAYAGSPQGRGLDETGEKGALLVTIEREGEASRVEAEFRPLAPHRIFVLALPVTGASTEASLAASIEAALGEAGVRAEDIVVARLEGRWPRGSEPRLAPGIAERFFHLVFDTGAVAPDYDFDALRQQEHTVAGAFTRRILALLETESDEERQFLLRNALSYGLDALYGEKIAPRYERGGA